MTFSLLPLTAAGLNGQPPDHEEDVWFDSLSWENVRTLVADPFPFVAERLALAKVCAHRPLTVLYQFQSDVPEGAGFNDGGAPPLQFQIGGLVGSNTLIAVFRDWGQMPTLLDAAKQGGREGFLPLLGGVEGAAREELAAFLLRAPRSLNETTPPDQPVEERGRRSAGVHLQWSDAHPGTVKPAFAHVHLGGDPTVLRDNLSILSTDPHTFAGAIANEPKFRLRSRAGTSGATATEPERVDHIRIELPNNLRGLQVVHHYAALSEGPVRDGSVEGGNCPPCCKINGYFSERRNGQGAVLQTFHAETILYDCYRTCPDPDPGP